MRALAWEFPYDPQLAGVDTQFLLGPSLLVTPVLEPQVDYVKGVFPGLARGEVWYDWYTQEKVRAEANVNTTIPAPLGHIPVFVRGGSVIPLQEPGYTTRESRKKPWGLIVALDGDGEAKGSLYVDDGESVEVTESLDVRFWAGKGRLKVLVSGDYADDNVLGNVTILGVEDVGRVRFDEQEIGDENVEFGEGKKVLRISGLNQRTKGGAWKGNWTISWA